MSGMIDLAPLVKSATQVQLQPGNVYTLTLKEAAPEATILGAPGAKVQGLSLNTVNSVTFEEVDFDASVQPLTGGAKSSMAFEAYGCKNLVFHKCRVHGMSQAEGGMLANTGGGLFLRNCQFSRVGKCEFEWLHNALGHLNCDDLLICNNFFHHLYDDCFRGGGTNNLTFTGNRAEANHIDATDTDHPDFFQTWTSTPTDTGIRKVTGKVYVTDNFYRRKDSTGLGNPTQCCFGTTDAPYFEASDNIYAGSAGNGIWITSAGSVILSNNIVASFPDLMAKINFNPSVTLTGNQTQRYGYIDKPFSALAPAGNSLLEPVTDGGAALLAQWLARRTRYFNSL